ncbi:hypothetical protein ACUOFC_63015, partial [Escherichia sp. TWPC-MK]
RQATSAACRAGIDTIIAAGSKPGVIGDVMEGISVGTLFHAQATPLENRKRWIFGAPPAGEITLLMPFGNRELPRSRMAAVA